MKEAAEEVKRSDEKPAPAAVEEVRLEGVVHLVTRTRCVE
jgi:hypothetical protein